MMHTNLSIVWVLSLVALVSHVICLESENIIGGRLAKKHKVKYQISVQVLRQHLCGGTLITPDIVLTAASCFYHKKSRTYQDFPYYAVAGTKNANDVSHRRRVATVYLHKRFKKDGDSGRMFYDIALLKLDKGFDVGKHLPITLASLPSKHENFVGKTAIVSGFGWDQIKRTEKTKSGSSSNKLKQATVKIVSPKGCLADKYPQWLCGQVKQLHGSHNGICVGDSGGPLVYKNKVIGIVSTGPKGCDESRRPATYTKVSEFLDFINGVLSGKLTSDTSVYKNSYITVDMPLQNSIITTKSIKLVSVLKIMKSLRRKILDHRYKNEKLFQLVEKLGTECMQSQGSDIYSDKHRQFVAKYKEFQTNFKNLHDSEILMNNFIKKYSSLVGTETVYRIL